MDGENERRERVLEILQEGIEAVRQAHGSVLSGKIKPIIYLNYEQGRVESFLDNGDVRDCVTYVWRVRDYYTDWQPYLYRLQREHCPETWSQLLDKLQRWAYSLLWHYAFAPRRAQHSSDCAVDAASVLLKQRFPYDTHFEKWAYVILRNVTLKYVRETLHSKSVPAHEEIELEAKEGWVLNLRDTRSAQQREQTELREKIVQVMCHLSQAQQQFIYLHYFEERAYDEIARIMERSKNALYKLNYDAIRNLRKNWG